MGRQGSYSHCSLDRTFGCIFWSFVTCHNFTVLMKTSLTFSSQVKYFLKQTFLNEIKWELLRKSIGDFLCLALINPIQKHLLKVHMTIQIRYMSFHLSPSDDRGLRDTDRTFLPFSATSIYNYSATNLACQQSS